MSFKFLNNNSGKLSFEYIGNNSFKENEVLTFNDYNYYQYALLDNVIDYTIAYNQAIFLTDNKLNGSVFNPVFEQKTTSTSNLSALGMNLFSSSLSLSAISLDGSITNPIILGYSSVESDRSSIIYSFNSYLKINQTYLSYDNDRLSSGVFDSDGDLSNDNYFYLNIIDSELLYVIKQTTNGEKYLYYNTSTDSLSFTTEQDSSELIYSYNQDNNQILLIVPNQCILGVNGAELSAYPIASDITDNNLFTLLDKNYIEQEKPVRDSFFVEYNGLSIDKIYPVGNNFCVFHNYPTLTASNVISLKNNVLYNNKYSLIDINKKTNFREYTCIDSGIRGDSSYENIVLNYNNRLYNITCSPDKTTYFHAPYSLGGYDRININDLNLLETGAIGGNTPNNSDKLFKYLYEYEDFRNTGDIVDVDTGQYLCTWLYYNPYTPDQSLWLDRYYNPDVSTKLDALNADSFEIIKGLSAFSRDNNLVGSYKDYISLFNQGLGVYDLPSRMCFEPNVKYAYHHIGKKDSDLLFKGLSTNKLIEKENLNTIQFIETDNLNDLSINLVLDSFYPDQLKSYILFDSDNVSIHTNNNITPYLYTYNGNSLSAYDYTYSNLLESISLSANFSKLVSTDSFKEVFVLDVDNNLYRLLNNRIIDIFSSLKTITVNDFYYYNNNLYILDDSGNYYSFDYYTDTLTLLGISSSDKTNLVFDGIDVTTYVAEKIDYTSNGNIYRLSADNVYRNNVTTPLLVSTDTLKDFVVDDKKIYILKDDALLVYDISNNTVTDTITLPGGGFDNIEIVSYYKNKTDYKKIYVYDTNTSTWSYEIDINNPTVKTLINKKFSGTLVTDRSNYFYSKYNSNGLYFDLYLDSNFSQKKEKISLSLTIDEIKYSYNPVINLILDNKYGNIILYSNGRLLKNYIFDSYGFYNNNILIDDLVYGNIKIGDKHTYSDNLSGSFVKDLNIKDFSIYNKPLNFYEVGVFNRLYETIENVEIILPVAKRSFKEEISGYYTQSKSIQNSNYLDVNVDGLDVTDEQKTDIKTYITNLMSKTYINKEINSINIDNFSR